MMKLHLSPLLGAIRRVFKFPFFLLPVFLSFVYLQYFPPDQPDSPYRFEIKLTAASRCRVKVYYDVGNGYAESSSGGRTIEPSAGGQRLRFVIPAGTYHKFQLRFDQGDALISGIRIVTRHNFLIHRVAQDEYVGRQAIQPARDTNANSTLSRPSVTPSPTVAIVLSSPLQLLLPFYWFLLPVAMRGAEVFSAVFAVFAAAKMWADHASRETRPPTGIASDRPGLAKHLPCIVTCAAAFLILIIRKTDAVTNPQFWAEDGVIFFLQNIQLGWRAFVTPYAGYLHFFPRLVAATASMLSPCWLPAAYNLSAGMLTLVVVCRFFSPRFALPEKPWFALALVLVPHTGEVFLNLTNIQWITCLLLIQLFIMQDASSCGQQAVDLILLIAAGLTGPFIVLFLPLFAWRYWARKTRASLSLLTVAAVIACVQGWFLQHSMPAVNAAPIDFIDGPAIIYRRILFSLFFGPNLPDYSTGLEVALVGSILLAALVCFSLRKGPNFPIKAALWYCFFALVLSSALKLRPDIVLPFSDMIDADRYFYVPKVLLLWLIILEFRSDRRFEWGSRTAFLLILMANLSTLRCPPFVDLHWHDYCRRISRGEAVDIPVNPGNIIVHYPGVNRP